MVFAAFLRAPVRSFLRSGSLGGRFCARPSLRKSVCLRSSAWRCNSFSKRYLTISRSSRLNLSSPHTFRDRSNVFSPLYLCSSRSIFVQIDKTPNVYSLKFTPTGHTVLPEKMTLNVGSYKEAIKKSELAKELFIIEGVTNVFLTDSFISVTVDDTSKWADIQGSVVSVINDFLLSKQSVLVEGYQGEDGEQEDGNYSDDDDVVAVIRELIDTRIRPNVQYDGGDVVYKGFDAETGVVKLELVGACKGCSSSSVTLYNGIERMLTFYIPEVTGIEEIVSEETQRLNEISQAAYDAVADKLEQGRKDSDDQENK